MEQKDLWCSSVLTSASTAPRPLFPASISITSDATSSITTEGDRQRPVDSSTTTEDNPTSSNNVIWSQILSRGTASGGNDINTNSEQSQRELLPLAPSSTVRPATSTEFLVPDDWELPMARSFGFHGDESSSCSAISTSLATLLSYPSLLPDDRLSSSTAVTLQDFPHHIPPNQVKQEYQMLEYSGSSNATATTTIASTTTWLQGSNSYNYLREPERPSLTKIHSDCINRASLPFHFFDSSSVTNNSFIGNNVGGYNCTSTQDLLPADHASQLQCFDGNTSSSTALLPAYIHNITGQPSLTTTVIPCQLGVFEGLNNNSKDQQLASSSNCVFNHFPNIDVSSTPSLHNSSEQKQINEEPAGSNKRARIDSSGSASSGLKVRKEKLGDRITSLQQLVSPFGKTDTASVLLEAIGYIKFLQEQVQVLSMPYMKATAPKRPRGGSSSSMAKEGEFLEEPSMDLRSRGLCLVPVSCTFQVANDNGADFWAPSLGSGYR